MSLTSYRAAPPRGGFGWHPGAPGALGALAHWALCSVEEELRVLGWAAGFGLGLALRAWQAWRRPTLPRLEPKYHRRGGLSRPSSGWDRVGHPRYGHQAGEDRRFVRSAPRLQFGAGRRVGLWVRSLRVSLPEFGTAPGAFGGGLA